MMSETIIHLLLLFLFIYFLGGGGMEIQTVLSVSSKATSGWSEELVLHLVQLWCSTETDKKESNYLHKQTGFIQKSPF